MVVPSRSNVISVFLLLCGIVAGQNGTTVTTSSPVSVTFTPQSEYSTKVYNVSAATTTLTYDYSDEELAMLWNQIGKIAVGPITTTVSPTPEPSTYPRPGAFHPQVCS